MTGAQAADACFVAADCLPYNDVLFAQTVHPPLLLHRSLYLWAPVPGGKLTATTASTSTSMPQASSSGALRSSAKFTFFDADPWGKKTTGTKRKGGPGGKGGPAEDSDDD